MKKIYLLCLLIVLAFPLKVGAHTHLETTEPQAGESLSADDPVITLTFDSAVQQPNAITITDESGEELTVEEVVHSPGNVVTVTLPEEVENGEVTLFYSIVGEDGHIMEDELTYRYEGGEEEDPNEADSSEKEETDSENTEVEEPQDSENTDVEAAEESDVGGSAWLLPLLAVGLIAVAVLVFLITRKKT